MSFAAALESLLIRLPKYKKLVSEREKLDRLCGFPPGHFYSPIPSLAEIERDDTRIFGPVPRAIPGIDLREQEQLELLEKFLPYYRTMPFPVHKTEGMRFYFENPQYSYSDGAILHCMIRHLQPGRIVEIGSGFSSCAILDTNRLFFDGSISVTLIEPYPETLMSLFTEEDAKQVKIVPLRLQDVGLEDFEALEPNDILFVDSTHVAKTGSDVNRIFFEILPALSSGVHIHFHDVFYPFEYLREWVYQGRAWNEIYLLRAFLQYNDRFRIVFMNSFLKGFHEEFFRENMPLCLKDRGGSIWIRKE
ncbi:MAG: class I SAM-dependent methyltransferase [Deltaproteobacteria bacterium]|nr:class I SAM-dependent methyltransferase [Deltaproteobacteria bacterium]